MHPTYRLTVPRRLSLIYREIGPFILICIGLSGSLLLTIGLLAFVGAGPGEPMSPPEQACLIIGVFNVYFFCVVAHGISPWLRTMMRTIKRTGLTRQQIMLARKSMSRQHFNRLMQIGDRGHFETVVRIDLIKKAHQTWTDKEAELAQTAIVTKAAGKEFDLEQQLAKTKRAHDVEFNKLRLWKFEQLIPLERPKPPPQVIKKLPRSRLPQSNLHPRG